MNACMNVAYSRRHRWSGGNLVTSSFELVGSSPASDFTGTFSCAEWITESAWRVYEKFEESRTGKNVPSCYHNKNEGMHRSRRGGRGPDALCDSGCDPGSELPKRRELEKI